MLFRSGLFERLLFEEEEEDLLGLKVCFLLRAKMGDESSSHGLLPILSRDSLTTCSGKLSTAMDPLVQKAAWSYAKAAASAVSNVPIHTLTPFLVESLISAANFPHGLLLTPLYGLFSFFFLFFSSSCAAVIVVATNDDDDNDDDVLHVYVLLLMASFFVNVTCITSWDDTSWDSNNPPPQELDWQDE